MLDQYIRLYGRRLYGLCLTLCADPFEADDLYQETWLRALKNLSRYDTSRDFEPWITKICVNLYRSRLRRLAKSPFFDAFATTGEKDLALERVEAPEGEDYSELRAAIDRLPERLRVAVILFYFRDMDINATASALNIPPGTVKSRLSKARKLLKEVLADEQDLRF